MGLRQIRRVFVECRAGRKGDEVSSVHDAAFPARPTWYIRARALDYVGMEFSPGFITYEPGEGK